MFERPKSGERAVLVHITFAKGIETSDFREFNELALAAGAESCARIFASRDMPDPKFFIGKGKVEEIKSAIAAVDADVVLFNHELSPAQERNLERFLKCRVLSRTGLILDIFAQRARTFEGKLQVELAQLEHLSTRLVRGWTHLERQKGGIGLRGPGETQLESDRRLLRGRILYIKKRLDKVKQSRQQSRRARQRQSIPTVALVGYTNAGKSTLFNVLTQSEVFVANQLFATLDPTLRMAELAEVGKVIFADTVGFVSHLPHDLVDAFKATLEEVSQATLLLHVVDAHDAKFEDRIHQVNEVLQEIDAAAIPQLMVFNKVDLLTTDEAKEIISTNFDEVPNKTLVSARTKEGVKQLFRSITEALSKESMSGWVQLTPNDGKIRALLFQQQAVLEEQQLQDGGCCIKFRMTAWRWQQLCQDYEGLSSKLKSTNKG